MTSYHELTRVCKHWPRSASQILIVLSLEDVAAYDIFALSGTPTCAAAGYLPDHSKNYQEGKIYGTF